MRQSNRKIQDITYTKIKKALACASSVIPTQPKSGTRIEQEFLSLWALQKTWKEKQQLE